MVSLLKTEDNVNSTFRQSIDQKIIITWFTEFSTIAICPKIRAPIISYLECDSQKKNQISDRCDEVSPPFLFCFSLSSYSNWYLDKHLLWRYI